MAGDFDFMCINNDKSLAPIIMPGDVNLLVSVANIRINFYLCRPQIYGIYLYHQTKHTKNSTNTAKRPKELIKHALLPHFVKYCEKTHIINKNKLAFMIISHFSLYLCRYNYRRKDNNRNRD